MVHRISCFLACGIFSDQALNLCLLHWQVDNYGTTREVPPVDFTKGPLNQFESVLVTVLGDSLFTFIMRNQRLLVEIKNEAHGPLRRGPSM